MRTLRRAWPLLVVAGCFVKPSPPGSVTGDAGGSGARDAALDSGTKPGFLGRAWHQRNASAPGALFMPKLAWDPTRHSVVLYGGEMEQTMPFFSNAAWELGPTGDWQQICGPCAPGALVNQGLAYAADAGKLLVYGGCAPMPVGNVTVQSGLWQLDANDWSQVSPTTGALPAMHSMQMVYEAGQARVAILSGSSQPSGPAMAGVYLYSATTKTWLISTAGNAQPTADRGSEGVYDPVHDRTFVFAGTDPINGLYDDMYSFSTAQGWSVQCQNCTGSLHRNAAMVFDPDDGSILMISGYGTVGGSGMGFLNTIWKWDGTSFAQAPSFPVRRSGAGIAYDPERDVIVMYGGRSDPGDCTGTDNDCAETWEGTPTFGSD